MKKLLSFLLVSLLLISTLGLIACGNTEKPNPSPSPSPGETPVLAVPSGLVIGGNSISWLAVPNAAGYVIKVGNEERSVTEIEFNLTTLSLPPGNYQVSVKAIGQTVGGVKYLDSNYSSPITYVVKASVAEGLYIPTKQYFNGQVLGNDPYSGATREYFKFLLALYTVDYLKAEAQSAYPGLNLDNLTILRMLFGSLFDSTSITTVEGFWYAFAISLYTEAQINEFITEMMEDNSGTFTVIEIIGYTISIITFDRVTFEEVDSDTSTFVLQGEEMILANPPTIDFLSYYRVYFTYDGSKIIMLEELPNKNVFVTEYEYFG